VLIIGGGIGGITAALALRRKGVEVAVYERSPLVAEVGAGISLWPNAIKALRKIGVDSLDSISVVNREGVIRRANGAVLAQGSGPALEQRLGGGVVVFHRAELLAALIQAAANVPVYAGHECTGIDEEGSHVSARFRHGAVAHGDVIVGADGLRSTVRRSLGIAGDVRYSGYTAWRSIVTFDVRRFEAGESWGRGRRFGFVPLSGGRVYWYATRNAPEGELDDGQDAQPELRNLFADWHEPIPALIRASTRGSILRNDIYDRQPVSPWGRGRVTLLGDAAHPMTPDLGQGACQAIEDGLELARALDRHADPEQALRQYEAARTERTASIVMASRRIGALGQLQNPVLCSVRDVFMRWMPSSLTLRQLVSIAGYEGHLDD
jgi:2-polyprenyl-6-methoxyphenol hydroxylase-like FAD-dependent oxidoreductase